MSTSLIIRPILLVLVTRLLVALHLGLCAVAIVAIVAVLWHRSAATVAVGNLVLIWVVLWLAIGVVGVLVGVLGHLIVCSD